MDNLLSGYIRIFRIIHYPDIQLFVSIPTANVLRKTISREYIRWSLQWWRKPERLQWQHKAPVSAPRCVFPCLKNMSSTVSISSGQNDPLYKSLMSTENLACWHSDDFEIFAQRHASKDSLQRGETPVAKPKLGLVGSYLYHFKPLHTHCCHML